MKVTGMGGRDGEASPWQLVIGLGAMKGEWMAEPRPNEAVFTPDL